MMRKPWLAAACLWTLACGSSDRSPLILGGNPLDKTLGLRALTASQSEALQGVITSAGELCAGIERAYLNDLNVPDGGESWAVRCADGAYAVRIPADGSTRTVYKCRDRFADDIPCFQGRQSGSYRYGVRDPRSSGPLNPELGKLLEPMTTNDGKAVEGGR